jgi:hypothetical protein
LLGIYLLITFKNKKMKNEKYLKTFKNEKYSSLKQTASIRSAIFNGL